MRVRSRRTFELKGQGVMKWRIQGVAKSKGRDAKGAWARMRLATKERVISESQVQGSRGLGQNGQEIFASRARVAKGEINRGVSGPKILGVERLVARGVKGMRKDVQIDERRRL